MYFNIIVVRRGDNLLASSTVGMTAVWGQQPGLRKKSFCRFTQHIKNRAQKVTFGRKSIFTANFYGTLYVSTLPTKTDGFSKLRLSFKNIFLLLSFGAINCPTGKN